jgi:hypothetical protein
MPFLTRGEQVEIVCVSKNTSKSVDGADLATHLASNRVTVTGLEMQHGDVANFLCRFFSP